MCSLMQDDPRLLNLLKGWREEAHTLRNRYGDEVRAKLLETLSAELQEVLHSDEEQTYNLADAAALTNYTADYLGRKVRSGDIPNRGRKHAPRVRLSECPKRSTPSLHTVGTALHLVGSSKGQIARAVVANS